MLQKVIKKINHLLTAASANATTTTALDYFFLSLSRVSFYVAYDVRIS
jgi:hypothetical protein